MFFTSCPALGLRNRRDEENKRQTGQWQHGCHGCVKGRIPLVQVFGAVSAEMSDILEVTLFYTSQNHQIERNWMAYIVNGSNLPGY